MLEHLRAVVIALLINIVIGESNVSVPGGKEDDDLKSIVRQLVTDYYKLSHDPTVLADPSLGNSSPKQESAPGGLPQLPPVGPLYPSKVPSDQLPSASRVQNVTDYGKESGNDGLPVNGAFTLWTSWSSCPDGCGRTALRSRERYCTNPAPANNGKNCEGPRFQLKLCKIKRCKVNGGLTTWTAWSPCSSQCGLGKKKRHRYCTNPPPGYGGTSCPGPRKQIKSCYGRLCPDESQSEAQHEADQESVVDIDPKVVCGFDPCHVTKCAVSPHASCVSDFKCQPVFFGADKNRLEQCKGDQLYLRVDPQTVCRFNPCKFSRCQASSTARCKVNTRCHPIYVDEDGLKVDCQENDEEDKETPEEGGELESDAERLKKLMKLKQTDDEDIDDNGDDDDNNDDNGDEEDDKKRMLPRRLSETGKLKSSSTGKRTRFHQNRR